MKKFLLSALILFTSIIAFAQGSIKVQAPNLVGLSEQFNVSFVISSEHSPSDFNWDPGDDFQLVWGPQKGSSTSIRIINGKRSSERTTSYTYVLLPKKVGYFTLSAASAKIDGKVVSSDSPVVEVVADGSSSSSNSSSSSGSSSRSEQSSSSQLNGEDIFLRFSFSKKNVVVGEALTATLKLYQRVNVVGFEDVRFPEFNGFWSQELQSPSNIEFQRENVGDRIYNSAVLRSWTLIPQQSGELKIDPAELVCLINVRTSSGSTGSLFDSFFQNDYQTIRKRVGTSPVTLNVSALPSGAPASFGGGVGKFKLSAALTKDSLKTHDAASLMVTVSGNGNLSLIEAPKVSFPPDFELYDVRVSDKQGAKVFEYPFIPRSHGDFEIGPIEYTYFDINTRAYTTLKSDVLKLAVARSESSSSSSGAGQLISGPAQKDVRSIGEDIRYIKTTEPNFSTTPSFLVGSTAWWLIVAAALIAAVSVLIGLKRSAARRADVVGSKNRAAMKLAKRRLTTAQSFLEKDLPSAFYEELHRALLGYVSDKFNMDANDMSKDNIAQRFVADGISEQKSSEFVELLDQCEFARYAPSSVGQSMREQYDKALELISSIEQNMRKIKIPIAAAILTLVLLLPASLNNANAQSFDKSELQEIISLDRLDDSAYWSIGVEAYSNSQWDKAREAWEELEAQGITNWELYYNLGNVAFRQIDIAHAILYYERALKLNPSNDDIKFNLEIARTQVLDRIETVPEFFITTWIRQLRTSLSSNLWAILGIVLFVLALAMILIFILSASVGARKTGFILGLIAFLLSLTCTLLAFSGKKDYYSADEAVVVRAVVSVKSSPSSQGSKDLFVLHEGTKLKLIEQLADWSNVELSDGRQGWVRSSELELI